MSFLIFSSVVSLVLVALISVVGLCRGFGGAARVSALAMFASLLFSPFLLLQSFLSLVVVGLCALLRLPRAAIVPTSAAALVFSYWMLYPAAELNRLAQLRERYPLVSLSQRLSYEPRRSLLNPHMAVAAASLSPAVEQQLQRYDSTDEYVRRRVALERLHDRTYREFVIARGFGNFRMGSVSPTVIELPEIKPIPLPYTASSSSPLGAFRAPHDVPPPYFDGLGGMHAESQRDFLEPERLGYVRDRNHVAGFISHRFTKVPDVQTASSTWRVSRLELISLLKHDPPAVYVAEHLPNMDQLRDAPTRPLDGFERDVLPRLRSSEDLVSAESADRIRLIGSLRASNTCLECHSVKRGELLGAFSYELVPVQSTGRPVQQEAVESEPPL